MTNFEKVKNYLLELGFVLKHEDVQEELVVVDNEEDFVKNMIIDCQDPILVVEQLLFEISADQDNAEVYRSLLQMNRHIVFGAIVLDEDAKKVLFRNTLLLETLDKDELEGTINSLTMFVSEHLNDLITLFKS